MGSAGSWFAVVFAFVSGAAIGWLLRGVASNAADVVDGDLNGDGPDKDGRKAPLPEKIEALEAELKKTAALIEADADDHEALLKSVAELDEQIKQASSRLKQIIKAAKRK